MTLIKHTNPCMIIADEGKRIRLKNDESENVYYSTVIFVPQNYTEEDMLEQYIEEVE